MKGINILLALGLLILVFVGCGGHGQGDVLSEANPEQDTADSSTARETAVKAEYRKITPEAAKEMMENENGYILLDVRAQSEFDEGHIEGAVLIPDTEVAARAEQELPDKDAVILIYCRSGRRSALAANKLISLGYTNIYDFGGIIDWPYDIAK